MNNDTIRVTNLIVFGHHGVFADETHNGQSFAYDIEVTIDAEAAARDDDYAQTVCYGRLCDIVREVSDAGPYQLLETLGSRIARQALNEFPMALDAEVTIRKPEAPINAEFDDVGVTIRRKKQYTFALSLGSNVGEKATNLRLAQTLIATSEDVEVHRASRHYVTQPWGNEDQDLFLNACLMGTTTLRPHAFLRLCKTTELQIGRVPGERWGPRLIDIDILTHGDVPMSSLELTLPHPEIFNRVFVLKPLAEIAPDLKIDGISIADALSRLEQADPSQTVEPARDG